MPFTFHDINLYVFNNFYPFIGMIAKKGEKMAVIFDSVIKTNPLGRWYIEIRDTTEEDKSEICLDINEYAIKIEELGAEYGGDVQVVWSSEENVTQDQISEVRGQMMEYEASLDTPDK
jgi:hypothetical protein